MAMQPAASFFWRNLEHPGHDCCRLFRLPKGWRLAGSAVFLHGRRACDLAYEVVTDASWLTRRARVHGHVGPAAVDLRIRAGRNGTWFLDGEAQPQVQGCIDLDFAFTPATNLIALKRLALRVGQRADAPAAWLEFPRLKLRVLPQTYERASASEYDYAAPTVGYAARLKFDRQGAIIHYPGLFERVARG